MGNDNTCSVVAWGFDELYWRDFVELSCDHVFYWDREDEINFCPICGKEIKE